MTDTVGFQKLAFAPRLTGAALGAGFGLAAAPEDEGATGALTGAMMGYGLAAGGDWLHKKVTAPNAPGAAPSAGPKVTPGNAGPLVHSPEELAAAHAEIERHLNAGPPAAPVAARSPGPIALSPERAQNLSKLIAPARQRPVALPHNFRMASEKVGFAKLADSGLSVGARGYGVNLTNKDERLEGMHRWVPRGAIERAYSGLDEGLDDQALIEEALDRDSVRHPAIGAAIGAGAGAHLGKGGLGPLALGALTGGGLGALYNRTTAPGRGKDMEEALRGVHLEKRKTRGMAQQSASEPTPLVVSTGGDT